MRKRDRTLCPPHRPLSCEDTAEGSFAKKEESPLQGTRSTSTLIFVLLASGTMKTKLMVFNPLSMVFVTAAQSDSYRWYRLCILILKELQNTSSKKNKQKKQVCKHRCKNDHNSLFETMCLFSVVSINSLQLRYWPLCI